jgi:hypothetical protein
MTNLKRILVAMLAAFLLPLGGAAAETFTEQLLRSDMQTHPDWSVVFMDVKILEEGKERICAGSTVNAVSDEGGRAFFYTPRRLCVPAPTRSPAYTANTRRGLTATLRGFGWAGTKSST